MESTSQPAQVKAPEAWENGAVQEKASSSRWTSSLSRLPFFEKEIESPTPRKLLPTAWMDGLRGLACLVVFNFHYFFAFDEIAMVGYGQNERVLRWIGLPFIRLSYEGVTAVSVFFCISGYVCSAKALKLMAAKETDKALRGLITSIFRRYLRLYLPVLFCMCCEATLAQLGAYDIIRPMFEDRDHHFPGRFAEPQLRHGNSVYIQVEFMLKEFWTLSEAWRPGQYYARHDPHYWTIPKEFGSGIVLFVILIGLAGCRNTMRLAGLLMFAVLANWYDKYDTMLFLFGAAMAQYEIMSKQKAAEKDLQLQTASIGPSSKGSSASATIVKGVRFVGYVAAIYFMSFPRLARRLPSPNDRWVLTLIPYWVLWKEMFVKSIGSMLLIFLLLTSENQISSSTPSVLHRLCNSKIALYMGRIMYPFYLVHGTVLHVIGYGIPYYIWAIIGQDNRLTWLIGYCGGWIVSFVMSVWVAEMFARHVEPRCARLTARIQEAVS